MVHFYNGDKTDAYLNLVDSEILPEADIEIVESPTTPYPPKLTQKPSEASLWCGARPRLVRILKLTICVLSLITIVCLSYSVHIQNRNIKLLREHVNIITGDLNATSLCDRSNTYYSNMGEEKHLSKCNFYR